MDGFQHLAKVRVAGSSPVVRSKKGVFEGLGAPAAPSRCLGASSFDHRGGSDGKPPGQLDGLSCVRCGERSGVILGRGLEPQQLGQLASCVSPVVTRGCQQTESFDMLASGALADESAGDGIAHAIPAVTALPAATSHREASRLSTAASSHASDLDKWHGRHLGRRGDGCYGVESSCTAYKVIELRTDEHDGIAANSRQNSRPSLAFGPALRRSFLEVVVEQLNLIASEDLGLFGEAGQRGRPFFRVGCRRAYGQHIEVAVGVGFASRRTIRRPVASRGSARSWRRASEAER